MQEREFGVRPCAMNLYEVYVQGGGEVPAKLKNKYTDPAIARTDIQMYLNNRRDYPARGRKKNAKREHQPDDNGAGNDT